MNKEVLQTVNSIKSGKSVLFKSNVFKGKLENLFYTIYDNAYKDNITFFSVDNIKILDSNMMMGIKYIFHGNYYYLILGSPSFYESVQQIALGKLENGNIYMMYESDLKPGEVKFVSFPESVINSGEEFEMSYCKKSHISFPKFNKGRQLTEKEIEYLEKGLEAFDCFKNLLKECKSSKEESKNLLKRKKLKI